jgi:hypothetical protein
MDMSLPAPTMRDALAIIIIPMVAMARAPVVTMIAVHQTASAPTAAPRYRERNRHCSSGPSHEHGEMPSPITANQTP